MELHLVIGGPLAKSAPELLTAEQIEIVGVFADYDDALDVWRGSSQRTIDDAEMRYIIVPLHRLVAKQLGLVTEES